MADTPAESFLGELVERMLFLDSAEAIRGAVQSVPQTRFMELLSAFDAAAGALGPGDVAEVELARVVRGIVEGSIADDSSGPVLDRAGPVVERAMDEVTVFSAYEVLREGRSMLTEEQFDALQSALFGEPQSQISIDFDSGLRALAALGVLLREDRRLAQALCLWGGYCQQHGRPEAAVRRFHRAGEIARRLGDQELLMQAEAGHASAAEILGDREGAVASLTTLLEGAERGQQLEAASSVRRKLVSLLRDFGRYPEALALLDREVAWIDMPDKPHLRDMAARVHLRRGLILEDVGRYDDGEVDYMRARELARQAGAREIEFEAMNAWAASALKRGDVVPGVRRFESVFSDVERWGHPFAIASTHNNLGTAYLQANRPGEAAREFGAALKVKIAIGDRYGEAVAYIGLGDARESLGDQEAAHSFWTLALVRYAESGDLDSLGMLASRLAESNDKSDDTRDP